MKICSSSLNSKVNSSPLKFLVVFFPKLIFPPISPQMFQSSLFVWAASLSPHPHVVLRLAQNSKSMAEMEESLRLQYLSLFPSILAEVVPAGGPPFVVPGHLWPLSSPGQASTQYKLRSLLESEDSVYSTGLGFRVSRVRALNPFLSPLFSKIGDFTPHLATSQRKWIFRFKSHLAFFCPSLPLRYMWLSCGDHLDLERPTRPFILPLFFVPSTKGESSG